MALYSGSGLIKGPGRLSGERSLCGVSCVGKYDGGLLFGMAFQDSSLVSGPWPYQGPWPSEWASGTQGAGDHNGRPLDGMTSAAWQKELSSFTNRGGVEIRTTYLRGYI